MRLFYMWNVVEVGGSDELGVENRQLKQAKLLEAEQAEQTGQM